MLTFEVLEDGCSVQARGMERLRFAPWGVAGGRPSAKMRCVLNIGRDGERELDKLDEFFLEAGDTMTFMLPGASGYGDPFLREPEVVLRDVRLGFVSRAAAERDYGVVIGPGDNINEDGVVDEEATRTARAARPRDNFRADFDFGPEREAWETVFDDETMCELNRRLYELPRARRYAVRKRIFQQALPDLRVGGGEPFLALFADPGAVRERLQRAMTEAFAAPAP